MFEMRDEYYTGIEMIDREHQELFRIAGEAYAIYKDQYIVDKFDYIKKIMDELKEYAITHFAHEEDYMKEVGYKRRLSHMIQHKEFLAELDEINLDNIDYNQSKVLIQILEFVSDWLVNHILECDKKIVKEEIVNGIG